MDLAPRLIDVAVPRSADGAVLVLHGGGSRARSAMVSPTQLSVLRMVPIARRIAHAGRGRLAVYRLLNTARGWDTGHTPVQDVRWALAQIAERHGGVRICLVGHSLGGRAALLSAVDRGVRSVVALAPWVYPSDVPDGLSGQQILIMHGTEDRIASPERSAALARRMARRAQVGYVAVRGARHAMLRRSLTFERLTAQFASATLLGTPTGGILHRLEQGDGWIEL